MGGNTTLYSGQSIGDARGRHGLIRKELAGGLSERALYATGIRKANHGALKIPLFRCAIVSVPAPFGASGLRSNQVVVQTFRGLHHAEDSDRSGRILCDAGRCRRCRSASQAAAASGGRSGWQVSDRQDSDRQISAACTARRDQGLTVCVLDLDTHSHFHTYAPLRRAWANP